MTGSNPGDGIPVGATKADDRGCSLRRGPGNIIAILRARGAADAN